MLDKEIRDKITALIKREVVPAVGCTEPVAVALAVAKASSVLGCEPEYIKVGLSGNILKNAMGVGIPGTGMIGLPIAIALGAIKREPGLGLKVLQDIVPADVEKGKSYIEGERIRIYHIADTPSNLYIDATVISKGHEARAVIAFSHTNFTHVSIDGETLVDGQTGDAHIEENGDETPELTLRKVWDYALESPIEELEFILEAKKLNEAAAKYALNRKGLGHAVGDIVHENLEGHFGGSVLARMISMTSGACDARMAGEQIAVMSNSGSGNQGIAITMPVVSYAESIGADRETLIRALTVAHLTSIYIKQSLGRLSALCGCVVASTGASMALVYLMGGDYRKGCYAVKNMIATLTGMICDGAKPACSLKIASGVSTAYLSALMAMNDRCVTSTEGIVDDDVDVTILNFSKIGREAMLETDRMVLSIMSASK